jgi:hypothetical protein
LAWVAWLVWFALSLGDEAGTVFLVDIVDLFCFVGLEGLFGATGYVVVSTLIEVVALVGVFFFSRG